MSLSERPARVLGTAVAVLAVAGCGAVNARPYLTPLPEALVDTLRVGAAELVGELAALATAEGLQIHLASPAEGYLETAWYDVEARRTVGGGTGDIRRVVRLRFFADPVGDDRTQLVSESVFLRSLDPSLPRRQNEMMAPPGHPGAELLQRIRVAALARFGGRQP